jgi:hypothetical protein
MREARSDNEDETHVGQQGKLARLIREYQDAYNALAYARSPREQEGLNKHIVSCLEQIYRILHEPLRRKAHNWQRSHAFHEVVDSIADHERYDLAIDRFAMQLFLHVLEDLHTIRIDPTRDLIGLCVKIAHRGMYREEHRIFSVRKRAGDTIIVVLPLLRFSDGSDSPTEREIDIADDMSDAAFARVIDQVSRDAQQRLLARALESITDPVDQQIVLDRLLRPRPLPFKQIAERIGAGWTAGTVRKRYERVRKQLLRFLRNHRDDLF